MRINISLSQHDPEAKPDSQPVATGNMPWANVDDLRYDDRISGSYMTGEWNYSVLDGSMDEFPDIPEGLPWGLWSEALSGGDGKFDEPPTLDITFDNPHKSNGLTLWFGSPAGEIRVTWFNADGAVIVSGEYTLDAPRGIVVENVSGYRRIKIEFLSTSVPERYLRMYKIDYGLSVDIPDSLIDRISILEEIDPIGDQLTVNTLQFSVRGGRHIFSPTSTDIINNMLMRKQRAVVKGDGKTLAVSFLHGPPRDVYGNGMLYEFSAQDAVGIMDGLQFTGGIYENELASDIISELFSICFPTGIIGFKVDSSFENATVSGWIPKCTCREALKQICFALGAVADTSRRDYVWIYPPDTEQTFHIPLGKILRTGGGGITPTDYYSGVELVAHGYARSDEESTGWSGELPPGDHIIHFTRPLHNIEVTGADILDSGANHVVLRVSAPGEIIVTGKQYIDNRLSFFSTDAIEAGEIESVALFDGGTLIDAEQAQTISEKLFAYLKNRTSVEARVVLDDLEVGYIARIETGNIPVLGTIERLEMNPRSERARVRIVGNYTYDKMIPERYAGTFRAGQLTVLSREADM